MNPWLYLIPTFFCFAVGACATYVRVIRESSYYLPTIVAVSLVNAVLWCRATKQLETVSQLMLFSLAVDALMVLAYYGGPILSQGRSLPPGAWYGAGLAVAGLVWFKLATEQ